MRESHFIPGIQEAPFGAPAPADLHAALEDFYLSRQAQRRTPATMKHYQYTAGEFVAWLQSRQLRLPSEVRPSHPRAWLAEIAEKGVKDTTLHPKARVAKTLLRVWHSEA